MARTVGSRKKHVLLFSTAGLAGVVLALLGSIKGARTVGGSAKAIFNGATASHADQPAIPRYAYLVDFDGGYLKIDTAAQKIVAKGTVMDDPSTKPLRPTTRLRTSLLLDAQYDPAAGTMYALLPSEQPSESAEAAYYWVVAFKLPSFALVSKISKRFAADAPPSLFLNTDSKELLVWDELRNTMEHYQLPQFVLLRSEPGEDDTYVTRQAYWWGLDEKIIDRYLILDRNGKLIKKVLANDLLTDSLREQFRSLERSCLGDPTKKCLGMTYADSAAGRMLFVLQNDNTAYPAVNGSGVAVYSISRNIIVSSFPIAYPATTMELAPTVHLTPDGERVVVEQYNWIKSSESGREVRFETGKIAVYDVERGELLNTITLTPPPGRPAHLMGFSPDSSLMYYAAEGRIYAVDLTAAKAPVVIPIEGYPVGKLFFANQ